METDPDWVPNKNLSSTSENPNQENSTSMDRHHRQLKRFENKKSPLLQNNTRGMDLLSETVTLSDPEEPEDVTADSIKPIATDKVEKGTQTDLTMETITQLERTSLALNDMTVEISSLRQKLSFNSFNEEEFRNNVDTVKFYTGLPTFALLMNVVNLISPSLHHTKNSLSKFQEILLVLIKIRLGLANKLLGHIFSIDPSTVSRIFLRVLNVMYYQMRFLIMWPKKEALQRTMPLEFVRCFSKRVAVIIDCFEVFIEQPSNIKARVETYSHYKSNNTIKYLIGITPQGSVCFISNGYGGRTSDKFIVENSDFLSHLEMGDIVMADRGFDCHESIGLMCADLKIPAFTRGKKQLSPYDLEATRKLAHLRIHVERVIGNMRQKSSVLGTTIPIDYVISSETEATTLDQIVTVSACIVNLCGPIVSFM